MDLPTIAVGVAAFGYGVFTMYLRKRNPATLGKLEAMKSFWGEKAGQVIHVVGYTVIPMLFGLTAILLGLTGNSLL